MLTQESIQSTIECENLVIRNLQVTQGYYHISQGMRKLIGSKNVSWCAFATHASKTAGQALRHENMPRLLKSAMVRMAGYNDTFFYLNDVLGHADQEEFHEESLLAEAMKRVSLLISAGNILVYKELAWPFTCLINEFRHSWDYREGDLQAFLQAHLRPGPLEEDGQDHLIEAFSAFYKARFETNKKRKAEYILQGNLLVGLHEQTRLQPYIAQALAVPFDVFVGERLVGKAGKAASLGQRVRQQTADRSRQLVTRAVTNLLMSITLPSRELKLGQTIIAPTGVMTFPENLYPINDPRCLALVEQFQTGHDTLSGSAAEDWTSLKDRMSFVVDFFRSHQEYKRLFDPPFQENQVQAIESGLLPAGPL